MGIVKKVLVVVAHPDDETIWMGGTLARNRKKWKTTVISLCRKSDSDRAPKFKRACGILNVKDIISDIDDKEFYPIKEKDIIKEITKFSEKYYDIVFTHGENGEYEHIRHKEIHRAVKEAIKKNIIKAKKVFFFSYLKKENNYQGYCIYNSNADKLIKLNSDELSLKKLLIQEVYGYKKDGFEEKSCGEIESFDEMKNENSSIIPLSYGE